MKRNQHFILTLGRSGSNTLVDLFNQNPELLNFGEVLGDWMPIRKTQRKVGLFKNSDTDYLDAILGNSLILKAANITRNASKLKSGHFSEMKRLGKVRSVGVKEFSLNMMRLGLADFLGDRKDIKVIGLVRRNAIDRMLSATRLKHTGIVSLTEGSSSRDLSSKSGPVEGLSMDPKEVLAKLEVIDAENKTLESMLSALGSERVLRIEYEDFYSTPQRTVEIACLAQEFLGVAPRFPNIRMRKITEGDPLAVLENSDEVSAAISNSRFADMLNANSQI